MINRAIFFSLLLILHFNNTIIIAQITKPLDLTDISKFTAESPDLYNLASNYNFDHKEFISVNPASFTFFSLSENNVKNELFNVPVETKNISILTIPVTVNKRTLINKYAYQDPWYRKSKVWKPYSELILLGSAIAIVGYSVVLIPPSPFPDFDSKKLGTQAYFIAGAIVALTGTASVISGILNWAKVNHQEVFPEPPIDPMKLLPTAENDSIKASITEILNQGQIMVHDMTNGSKGIPKNATAFDDRFEFMINNQKSVIYFTNLYTHGVTTISGSSQNLSQTYNIFAIENTEFKHIRKKNYFSLTNLENGFVQIRNQLFIELKARKYADELDAFKPLAANYRRLSEPPTMPEEQRRYIVQANVSLEEKNFNNAITFFNNAISVDPISYPTAYFNLALALALTDNYEDAILNMKKYLLLIPDSTEARDKIYEWELQLQK